ncbi:MAG: flagellar hook-associated protein FlgK [Deltaproteobacteria bacterium]|nr:flagellar hook-associated protein FlgK [Deltaproteobacteria bacterium]MCB9787807.1 flagellar hook-associated protein FlgK [Deltaproteobacteria bacterium]
MATLQEIFSIGNAGINAGRSLASLAAFNIANAQTPGFARRVPNFQAGGAAGLGVIVGPAQTIRNTVLARSLMSGQSRLGFHEGQLAALQVAETALNDLDGSGVSVAFTAFTQALKDLSVTPAGSAERQGVIGAAKSLATVFATTSAQLGDATRAALGQARDTADAVNTATQQIADLNARIRSNVGSSEDLVGLVDQREALLTSLSSDVEIQVVRQADGDVRVFTAGGRPLVTGAGASTLEVATTGTPPDYSIGVSITKPSGETVSSIAPLGGRLGGLINANNDQLGPAQARLDEIAFAYVQAFNTQHQSGTTPDGQPGGPFFTPLTSAVGAAGRIQVSESIVADPSLIATGGATSSGPTDNANVLALLGIPDQEGVMADGASVLQAYDTLVFTMARSINNADTGAAIEEASVSQVESLIASESGVNTDDELQRVAQAEVALQASATVAQRADAMTSALLDMLG